MVETVKETTSGLHLRWWQWQTVETVKETTSSSHLNAREVVVADDVNMNIVSSGFH